MLEGVVTGSPEIEKINSIRAKLLEYEVRMRRNGMLYDGIAAEEFFRKNLPPEVNSAKALKEFLQKKSRQLADKRKRPYHCRNDLHPG